MNTKSFTHYQWSILSFDRLTSQQLYQILALRNAIFIVEQNCPYLDIDDNDQTQMHLIATEGQKLAAYARLRPAQEHQPASFGRVIVAPDYRKQKLGHSLVEKAIEWLLTDAPKAAIEISAQSHLTPFYTQHKFVTEGEAYLEDNIPHKRMIRTP